MPTERVKLPRGSERGIAKLLDERARLERRALRELDVGARDHAIAVRDAILAVGVTVWTLAEHARVQRKLRELGRMYGRGVTHLARKHAHAAATLGAEQQGRAVAVMASAALGKRVQAPAVRPGVVHRALDHVDARTEDVGANAGEAVGSVAVAASYAETQEAEPGTAYALAGVVAALVLARARDRGGLVVTTEITAGFGIGGTEARASWGYERLRKRFDATLDARVCARCYDLHHVVVDADEDFPGGYPDAPIHARCRCAVWPDADSWSALTDHLEIGPGPRTGVQATAELQLGSFNQLAPMRL